MKNDLGAYSTVATARTIAGLWDSRFNTPPELCLVCDSTRCCLVRSRYIRHLNDVRNELSSKYGSTHVEMGGINAASGWKSSLARILTGRATRREAVKHLSENKYRDDPLSIPYTLVQKRNKNRFPSQEPEKRNADACARHGGCDLSKVGQEDGQIQVLRNVLVV